MDGFRTRALAALIALGLASLPLAVLAGPVVLESNDIELSVTRGNVTVVVPSEVLTEAGWQRVATAPLPDPDPHADDPHAGELHADDPHADGPHADDPHAGDPPGDEPTDPEHGLALLSFPPPRGEVIFEHRWQAGDVPAILQQPGGAMAPGTDWIAGKFRVARADGRFKIVTDPETGQEVLDILVTRDDNARARSHHTEIEVNIPGHWGKGRFMVPGQRYLLEVWRKNIAYTPDAQWEIWWQNHSMYDTSVEAGRNPSLAIDGGTSGENRLILRADPNAISFKIDGQWSYSRSDKVDIGPNTSDTWELWQLELLWDHRGGVVKLWRNGKLVHAEEGLPIGYNDRRGPPWRIGWYKYFGRDTAERRQAYIGPVRVQVLP